MEDLLVYYENEHEYSFDFDPVAIAKDVINEALSIHNVNIDSSVNLYIVNEEEIKDINRDTREIDKVTDVLSFPCLDFEEEGVISCLDDGNQADYFDMETGKLMLGDIVICYERILSQAEEYGHSIKREFAFLVTHSILHLLGYDHMEDDERERMEEKQRVILDKLGIRRDI